MRKTIHALLVGIDKYAQKSKVKELFGCLNDISVMEKFLEEYNEDYKINIKTLKNEEATKKNVIDNFRKHISFSNKIHPGDFILFYFSGHGSCANTPPEFAFRDGIKRDETFVCYDSRLEGHHDLADKEIAVLLSEVPKETHVVFIADSCHSGSITRTAFNSNIEAIENNRIPSNARAIPCRIPKVSHRLDAYFYNEKNYYTKRIEKGKQLSIPNANYIVLSACNRHEYASEEYCRGVFSYYLIKVLKEFQKSISYDKLFQLTFDQILKSGYKQTPQMVISGQFDFRKVFLSNKRIDSIPPYICKYNNGEWCLDYGAILGLSTDEEVLEKIRVCLYTKNADQSITPFEVVPVKSVKLRETHLRFDHKNQSDVFYASLVNCPFSMIVYINGSQEEIKEFQSHPELLNFPQLQFTDDFKEIRYGLAIDKSSYKIVDHKNKTLIHGCSKSMSKPELYILNSLAQIDKFNRLLNLTNSKTGLNKEDVSFQFAIEKPSKEIVPKPGSYIQIDYPGKYIKYQLLALNNSERTYHVVLLYFSHKNGIKVQRSCLELPNKSDVRHSGWVTLDNDNQLGIPDKNQKSVLDTFRLFVSTVPFNDYKFNECDLVPDIIRGINSHRDAIPRIIDLPSDEDWFVKTIQIELKKQ